MAEEFCHLASIDADVPAASLSDLELTHLSRTLVLAMEQVRDGLFSPNILYKEEEPV